MRSLHLTLSHKVSMLWISISESVDSLRLWGFFCSSCCSLWGQRYWRKGCRAANITSPTVEKYWGFWAKWKCFFSYVDLPLSNSSTAACTPTHGTSTSVQELYRSQNIRSLKQSNISLSLSTCSATNSSFAIFSHRKYGTDTSMACNSWGSFCTVPSITSQNVWAAEIWSGHYLLFLACHQNKSLKRAESSASSYGITLRNYQLVKFPG